MNSSLTPEHIFWRNFDLANKVDYDLVQVYGEQLANVFEIQAKFLLQDARVIAVATTSSVAYFSNKSSILLDNCVFMEKGLASYTLITTCSGFSKSDTLSEISKACSEIDEFETRFKSLDGEVSMNISMKNRSKRIVKTSSNEPTAYLCEKVLNEFTGPGCIAALADHSNVLGLFDEFDDDSQKTNIFPSKDKYTNSMINCKSFVQTVFGCPAKYIKATADRLTILIRPRLSIIGGSNGSILTEIIRKKLNNAMIVDPMVERFEFVSIQSTGTLIANRLQSLPPNPIRTSFLLLFVHMINGKKFIFDSDAQNYQKKFTDELTARSLRFERHDAWLSVRFRKSREYSLRMCAYLAIMQLAYKLAYEFVMKQPATFNSYDSLTFDLYKQVKKYIDEKNLPDEILIDEETVQSAHKATLTMILKYINLTSTCSSLTSPIVEVPIGPSATSMSSLGMATVPSTQESNRKDRDPTTAQPTIDNSLEYKSYCTQLMSFESAIFTRSSVHKDSRLKKQLKYFDHAVAYLSEIKLLIMYTNGVLGADGKPVSCYLKALPATNTHNTILSFSKILDIIGVQYPTYISTFKQIWLPDRNRLSDELINLLKDPPYNMNSIEYKYLPPKARTIASTTTMVNATLTSLSSSYSTLPIASQQQNPSTSQSDTNLIASNLNQTQYFSPSIPSSSTITVISTTNNTSLDTNGTSSILNSDNSNLLTSINDNVPRLPTSNNQSSYISTFDTTTRSSSSESPTVDKEVIQPGSDSNKRVSRPKTSAAKKKRRKRY